MHTSLVTRTQNSLLQDLRQALPQLRSQIYFKASLTALSHAMEDLVLSGTDKPLVIANFQQERFYRQEAPRYQKIGEITDQVYVLAAPETAFNEGSVSYMTVALSPDDQLAQEWHLVIVGHHYSACLVCREHAAPLSTPSLDEVRQFQGFWTFDPEITVQAARLLLERIVDYRPELAPKVRLAEQEYGLTQSSLPTQTSSEIDPNLFVDRMVNYLQASQYRLLNAYRTIASQEQKERLVNSIATAIRRSLNPEQILSVTVSELGQVFRLGRCLLHRDQSDCPEIEYESVAPGLESLRGQVWSLASHPLFQKTLEQPQVETSDSERTIAIADVSQDLGIQSDADLKAQLQRYQIGSCLMVPIRYRSNLLGLLELHQPDAHIWKADEVALVETISAQVAVALMQAQAYSRLEVLNHQLADLERTQSNLIAIVGHELRTPLSTIQVCLESLATEPDMPLNFQQIMLETALEDSERLRKLVQDFLTLSRLESGATRWFVEPISFQECLDLVLSRYASSSDQPHIGLDIPSQLPLVLVDGDGLIEVLSKLLDNACKFTPADGKIMISARIPEPDRADSKLEVVIADTGRGIESSRLEAVFDRFSQEEGFLQRTVGGTGLGLAICRRTIEAMNGTIWAESMGKNLGSEFHFTVGVA